MAEPAIRYTRATLDNDVRLVTAFRSYDDLVEHCRDGYVPTFSKRDAMQSRVGTALIEDGFNVYWIRPS